MIISVAMAVFNGEKYIKEQLISIANQSLRPDEIVISDDGSKDCTLSIVSEIAESYPEIDFIILTDNAKHGFCHNFEHAIENCSGDLIILSDQDDIWHPEKIEHTVSFYEEHNDAILMFHDASLIDDNSESHNGTIDFTIKKEISIKPELFMEPQRAP